MSTPPLSSVSEKECPIASMANLVCDTVSVVCCWQSRPSQQFKTQSGTRQQPSPQPQLKLQQTRFCNVRAGAAYARPRRWSCRGSCTLHRRSSAHPTTQQTAIDVQKQASGVRSQRLGRVLKRGFRTLRMEVSMLLLSRLWCSIQGWNMVDLPLRSAVSCFLDAQNFDRPVAAKIPQRHA
jgi:hypothetical protein